MATPFSSAAFSPSSNSGGSSAERRMGAAPAQETYQKLAKYLDNRPADKKREISIIQERKGNPSVTKKEAPRTTNRVQRMANMLDMNRLPSRPTGKEGYNTPQQRADDTSSVLDAANYGKRPYDKGHDASSDDPKSRNENFQQEMKDMRQRQEQFNQGDIAGDGQARDSSNFPEFSANNYDQTGDTSLSPTQQDKRRQQAQRANQAFRAQNQAALSEGTREANANQAVNSGSMSGILGGLWELARGRGRRFVTASTGVGVFLAIAESDLILYNRFFKKGSVKILPGSRPEGAYEADPSLRNDDYKELGINLILHVMGVIMIFGAFLQALPILFPFMVAVLGAAVLQNELGPAVADLLLQLAN
jgi:hypothetical protein